MRPQGLKPKDKCLTHRYTDGNVLLRRAIFRKLKELVKKHYDELCDNARNNIHGFNESNIILFDKIISIKSHYKNNVQKIKMKSSSSMSSNRSYEELSDFEKVLYSYKRKPMENCFSDQGFNHLFFYFQDFISNEGHKP